ncbi:DnaJ (Hsp40) homolog, subfamily C, member 7 [Seminavis robusta]|uniref:DnaJ (Hsp40) homolog, subfamily C, member 7 n=1 Tax=Seminavis robusta TaxID=568900 RepID=A0A9N8ERQ1_9STRA|nr:DnaJ (Hsp40) homolog, subfamily C, member 7 [Seminavis robusta]|eukprot:Sro1421_g271210.1 DnaJ (Hsp40) homolog, subfamily C, member 7 (833) ;mRNA; r:14323-16821
MGFDLTQVLSDDKHYGAFVCKLCESLVSLDAVVTVPCSHPFCRSCLMDWIKKQIDNQKPCVCPRCEQDLTADSGSSAIRSNLLKFGDISVMVQPLGEAQPLALEVLKMVQVACIAPDEHSKSCEWRGDYGNWPRHHQKHANGENGQPPMNHVTRSLSVPSLFNNNSKSGRPSIVAPDQEINGPFGGDNGSQKPPPTPADVMERQHRSASNLRADFNTPTTASAARQDSADPPESIQSPQELEVSYTDMDWNSSVGSIPRNNLSPRKTFKPVTTVDETNSELGSPTINNGEEQSRTAPPENMGQEATEAIATSEKLKKQANAKFNKGDFEGARNLYTEGLNVITGIITVGHEERQLVATLYSNRAVTYFREKDFQKCIDDCDKALEYEPTNEKSYIRKWRALMALGIFEAALDCLEQAHKEIPTSPRVKQELAKAREQKEVLQVVNAMIDGGNLEKAKETIKPLAKESDNIGLLLVAAMADAGLGLTESALDKVNKALRFNPNHVEALQLRGLVLFLSGEMEKGVRLLQELQNRNPGNAEIQLKVEQCDRTLNAFSKGRGYAKRGRYKEAVEQFTDAMDERALPLPTGTALYCLIKMERAEALLLSKHYTEALRDCKDALESEPENAEAWALKAEIYMCLGRAGEAKQELAEVRHTWGHDNMVIDEAYRKANFEMKVRRVDDELMQLINDVEAGIPEKVIIDGRVDGSREQRSSGMHQSEKRYGSSDRRSQMDKKAKSYRSLNKTSERNLKADRNRKDSKADRRSRRDRDRVRSGAATEGSSRTHGSTRTMNTNATGVSGRTLGTKGTNGASHRAKRSGAGRKKSSRALKVEK